MVKSKKTTGLIMACTAALAWSTFGTFSTLLSGYGLSEGTISLISPLFLLVGFTIVAIISSGIGSMKIPRKALVFLFLDGGCSALYNYACVQAYANLPIGIVSTVIYCNLFALIFICRIVFKDPITRQKLLAVGMALIGVMMVVNVFGAGSEGSITAKGLIWAFLAMLAWAGLMTNEKLVMDRGGDPNAVCAYEGLFSVIIIGIASSPVAVAHNLSDVFISSGGMVLLPILGFGLISTMTAYFFYMHAFDRVVPTYVQICYTLDPAVSCLLGLIVFGQVLAPIQIVGIIVVLVTVIWLQIYENKRESQIAKAKAAE